MRFDTKYQTFFQALDPIFEFSCISRPIFRGNGKNMKKYCAKYDCFTLSYNTFVSNVYLDYYGVNPNHMISGYSI